MPFIAECPYCGQKVRAPDHAGGWSVECRGCGNSFTLVPMAQPPEGALPPPGARPPQAAPPRPTIPRPAEGRSIPPGSVPPEGSTVAVEPPSTESGPHLAVAAPLPPHRTSADDDDEMPARRGWGVPVPAALALCATGLGLVAATLSPWPAVPAFLAGVGILLGMAALLQTLATEEGKIAWPLVAIGVGLPLLALSLVRPDILGGRRLERFTPPSDDPGRRLRFPLAAGGGTGTEVPASEYVDAGHDALQVGPLVLRVTSAAVRPLEVNGPKGPTLTRDRYLVVTLKLQNVGTMAAVEHKGWAPAPEVTARDDKGKALMPRTPPPPNKVGTAVRITPGKSAEETLYFEAPPVDVGLVHLDLPAAAFGAPGAVKLEIPRSMIAVR